MTRRQVRIAIIGKLGEWKTALERRRLGLLIPDPFLELEISSVDHAMEIVEKVINEWREMEEEP